MNKMAKETASITAACSTPRTPSLEQRESELPRTIHHSNKRDLHRFTVTIPQPPHSSGITDMCPHFDFYCDPYLPHDTFLGDFMKPNSSGVVTCGFI